MKAPLIWVVEDDASTARLIAEHLKASGFVPVHFDTAEKAYAALKNQSLPALILLDMLLPGMSGVDFIRLIKQNKSWEKVPVVVVTVLTREQAMGAGSENTGAFWVNKPFETGDLIQTVQNVLASVARGEAA